MAGLPEAARPCHDQSLIQGEDMHLFKTMLIAARPA